MRRMRIATPQPEGKSVNTTRDTASLAPIFVALGMLVAIGLLGLIVAFWPAEPASAAPRVRGDAGSIDRHEVSRDAFDPPSVPPRSRWM